MIPRRVVLLHGFTQGGGIWIPVMEAMTTRAPVDAPDLPGHGSASSQTTNLIDTSDELALRFGNSAWVGYSMGGRFALHVATRHPDAVSHLVLCSTTAGIEHDDERAARRAADHQLARHIRDVGVSPFLAEWTSQPMFAGLKRTPLDLEVRAENTAEGLASSLETCGAGEQSPLWELLPTLRMPVLVVAGARDEKFCRIGERMAALIGSNAEFVVAEGAGHAVPFERPQAFADLVSDFLR